MSSFSRKRTARKAQPGARGLDAPRAGLASPDVASVAVRAENLDTAAHSGKPFPNGGENGVTIFSRFDARHR
jgi:hypothetical protein